MRFTKMHGAGNDFIIIDNTKENIPEEKLSALAARLCSRRLSIGADGLMAVCPAKNGGDYAMLFYNSDGSLGEMCGNGARCICRYGFENGLAGEVQRVETTAGLVTGRRISQRMHQVRLNDPSTIVADEPTGNLDPNRSLEIMTLLERINALGTTVVVVTHERGLVNHFDKRVITINDGLVAGDGMGQYEVAKK